MEFTSLFDKNITKCEHVGDIINFCKKCTTLYCKKCSLTHNNPSNETMLYNIFLKTAIFQLDINLELSQTYFEEFSLLFLKIDTIYNEIVEILRIQKDLLKEELKTKFDIESKKKILKEGEKEMIKMLKNFNDDVQKQDRNTIFDIVKKFGESNLIEEIENINKTQTQLKKMFEEYVIEENFFKKCFKGLEEEIKNVENKLKNKKLISSAGNEYLYSGDHLNGIPYAPKLINKLPQTATDD